MSDKISNILPYRKHSAGNAPKARRDRDAEQAFGADRSGTSARCRRRTGFFRARGKSRAEAVPNVAQARISVCGLSNMGMRHMDKSAREGTREPKRFGGLRSG